MIPVNEPLFIGREKELLCRCIDTAWISSDGHFVKRFEEDFAKYLGVKHGIAVSNGTTALELAIASLRLKHNDEIIVPSFTIISCVLAIIRNGLQPILVDVDPETWCMDIKKVKEILHQRLKNKDKNGKIMAIMPVHIYGHPCDMDPLLDLADEYDLFVIEDAAEVIGAEYFSRRPSGEGERIKGSSKGAWRKCGSLGNIATFSFYANKIITTGEGGMVVTSDDTLAERARSLRNLCFHPKNRFLHHELGYNFRMTNLQAAVGVAQMETINELIGRKISQGKEYRKRLRGISDIRLQTVKEWARHAYWVNGFVLEDSVPMDAIEIARRFRDKGVQTRPFFWPMHEQAIFEKMELFKDEHHPITENLARRGLYLPSGMALTEEQIETVCDIVKETLVEGID